jgi:hypothetical protein
LLFPTTTFPPLSPAFPPNRLALCKTSLFALGHKEAFPLDRGQDAITGHFFAKAPQQVIGRFAISKINTRQPRLTSSLSKTFSYDLPIGQQ